MRERIWGLVGRGGALLAVVGLVLVFGAVRAAGQTTPAGTAAEDGEAVALLRDAAEAMAEVDSFHFVLSNERGTTALVEGLEVAGAEGDVQRPDRFRATVEASFAGLPLEVQLVGVGSRLWLTNPTGDGESFQEFQVDPELLATISPDALLQAAVDAIEEPEVAGEEEIDGDPVTVVDGVVDPVALLETAQERLGAPEGVDATAAAEIGAALDEPLFVEIWIDEAGRVRRLDLEGALTAAEEENVVRRLDLSAFDEPVEIDPPSA